MTGPGPAIAIALSAIFTPADAIVVAEPWHVAVRTRVDVVAVVGSCRRQRGCSRQVTDMLSSKREQQANCISVGCESCHEKSHCLHTVYLKENIAK